MSLRSRHICSLFACCVLLLTVGYSIPVQDRVPEILRFLPQGDALAVFIIGPIGRLWVPLSAHLRSIFADSKTPFGTAVRKQWRTITKKCVVINSVADLGSIGVDPTRPSAVGIYSDYSVVAIPIMDGARFEAFVESLEKPITITVYALHGTPVRFDVTPRAPLRGKLCDAQGDVLPPEQPATLEAKDGVAILTVGSDSTGGVVRVNCAAILADGTKGDCVCEVSAPATKVGGCELQVPGLDSDARRGIRYIGGFYVKELIDRGVILLASKSDVLDGAVRDENENLAAQRRQFRNADAGLQFGEIEKGENELLRGYIQIPNLLGIRQVPLRVVVDLNSVRLYGALGVETFDATIAERIITPITATRGLTKLGAEPGAAVFLRGNDIGYFAHWSFTYLSEAKKAADWVLGDFEVVIEQLASLHSVRDVALFLLDVRNAVPELVLAVTAGKEEADTLVRRLQSKLRYARDISVIRSAWDEYENDHHHPPVSIADLLSADAQRKPTSRPEELAKGGGPSDQIATPEVGIEVKQPYLKGADAPQLDYAFISLRDNSRLGDMEVPEGLLRGEDYERMSGALAFSYLSPRLTVDDLRYRLNSESLSPKARGALLGDQYRLCSTYVDATETLWVGSDAAKLEAVLQGTKPQSIDFDRFLDDKEVNSEAKIVLFARPDWLITQGMLHPDKSVKETAYDLADLAQYTAALVAMEPDERRNLLHLKVRLAQ